MSFYDTFDDAFWLTLAGLVFSFLGLVLNSLFKSKCKKCKVCCLEVERDVAIELQEERLELEHMDHSKEEDKNEFKNIL